MPNSLLTLGHISRAVLDEILNELSFTKHVNREYDDQFAVRGAKIGATANARKPVKYEGGTGRTIAPEDTTETSLPVVCDTQWNVPMAFDTADLTLSIDDFTDRYVKPAANNIATRIDAAGMDLARRMTANAVGTPGGLAALTPAQLTDLALEAGVRLDINACPRDGKRTLVLNPRANARFVSGLSGVFNSQEKVGAQYETGLMAKNTLGANWYMSQNVPTHTVGPLGGTPLVNGAGQVGTIGTPGTLVTDGWTAAAALRLRRGDRFTVAGVFHLNPDNRQNTNELAQFVVTADVSSDGSGNATIPYRLPNGLPIITTGPYRNVSAAPADNAAITVLGAANTLTPANILYHKNAFVFACVDLAKDKPGAEVSVARDKRLGMSVSVTRQYDITNDRTVCRVDVLGGWSPLYTEWACIVNG
jgi:hypothetical protein